MSPSTASVFERWMTTSNVSPWAIEIALAVARDVNRVLDDLDAFEACGRRSARSEFVVVAGDVDDARAGAGALEEMAHDGAVARRPAPAFLAAASRR